MKIYVASSWRNTYQPDVVAALRAAGHYVYDFRQPVSGDDGFHWSEIDGGWKNWSVSEYAKALEHPIAARGFASDMGALDAADLVVLVLPSGRSASWEYGYWCGKTGRQGIVHCPDKVEPELMYRGSKFTWTIEGLTSTVGRWDIDDLEMAVDGRKKLSPRYWLKSKFEDKLAADLKTLKPTPNLPFDVWSAIGQLVVQPAVELVIEDEHGGTLLTYRKDQHWDGWHIPGGFMAPGESLQASCSRTAKRELGVDVVFNQVLDVVAWPSHPYVNMISLFCSCSFIYPAGEADVIAHLAKNDRMVFDKSTPLQEQVRERTIPIHREFIERRSKRGKGR